MAKRARIDEAAFMMIRAKLDKYPMLTHQSIAELCGCSDATVDNVAHCRTWDEWEARKKMLNDKRKPMQAEAVEKPEIRPEVIANPDKPNPRHIKVYFANGCTGVFPLDRVKFWNTLPANVEKGTIAINWSAVSWFREYEEALD